MYFGPIQTSEKPLWSFRHGFAGTVDLVIRDTLGLIILDLKTHKPKNKTNPAYPEDLLQVAGYDLALHDMEGVAQMKAHHTILVACADGTFYEDHRYIPPEAFLDVLSVYRTMKEVA